MCLSYPTISKPRVLTFTPVSRYAGARMPPSQADSELVARANRGDTAAFEEIYRRHRDFVFRLALAKLGNADDALDVLQDIFLKLLARFPGFELRSAMSTFLYSFVDNVCSDRRARRRPTVALDAVEADPSASTMAECGDESGAGLLAGLEPAQRELLTLRFVDDLSLPQLAKALGVPVGTIKSRLHRAIATLRGKLATTERIRG